jgi:hypothetical protein
MDITAPSANPSTILTTATSTASATPSPLPNQLDAPPDQHKLRELLRTGAAEIVGGMLVLEGIPLDVGKQLGHDMAIKISDGIDAIPDAVRPVGKFWDESARPFMRERMAEGISGFLITKGMSPPDALEKGREIAHGVDKFFAPYGGTEGIRSDLAVLGGIAVGAAAPILLPIGAVGVAAATIIGGTATGLVVGVAQNKNDSDLASDVRDDTIKGVIGAGIGGGIVGTGKVAANKLESEVLHQAVENLEHGTTKFIYERGVERVVDEAYNKLKEGGENDDHKHQDENHADIHDSTTTTPSGGGHNNVVAPNSDQNAVDHEHQNDDHRSIDPQSSHGKGNDNSNTGSNYNDNNQVGGNTNGDNGDDRDHNAENNNNMDDDNDQPGNDDDVNNNRNDNSDDPNVGNTHDESDYYQVENSANVDNNEQYDTRDDVQPNSEGDFNPKNNDYDNENGGEEDNLDGGEYNNNYNNNTGGGDDNYYDNDNNYNDDVNNPNNDYNDDNTVNYPNSDNNGYLNDNEVEIGRPDDDNKFTGPDYGDLDNNYNDNNNNGFDDTTTNTNNPNTNNDFVNDTNDYTNGNEVEIGRPDNDNKFTGPIDDDQHFNPDDGGGGNNDQVSNYSVNEDNANVVEVGGPAENEVPINNNSTNVTSSDDDVSNVDPPVNLPDNVPIGTDTKGDLPPSTDGDHTIWNFPEENITAGNPTDGGFDGGFDSGGGASFGGGDD